MARESIYRAKCGHEGCNEFARYSYSNRNELKRLDQTCGYGKYRCVRHSQPDEVLSPENLLRTDEFSIFTEGYGRFWGKDQGRSGFMHGPSFKAFVEDFPDGTVLRVTAEIILPSREQSE